jgi:rsbT co-antagonist protein RsbR
VGEQMELDQVSEDRIADILIVLSEVSCSNFTTRLPELEESDVFSTLYAAINEMASTLADAHERTERYQNELAEKIATIEEQRVAIRELSTPVIEVWDGVLCLPIVGVMDTTRGAEMTEVLLRTVTEKNAKCAIIDVTGIEVMDTGTADHFLRAARAVRLLGTDCVLTGISPSIAQTIVHMGAELSGLTTYRSLRDALKEYNRTRSPLWATSAALPQGPSVNGRPAPSDRSTSR